MSTLPVSVIIPVFNGESTLERCVRSINTGRRPQEIVIVDDKSKDGSVEMAKRLATTYGNIKVILRPMNGGAAEARRDGLYATQCDYIAFVDADDYLEDGALDDAYETLAETGSDICILQLWRTEDGQESEFIDLGKVPFPITGREAVELTLGSWSISALGVAKRTTYLKAYDGFSLKSMNADELVSRLTFANAEKVVTCKKRYFYVANPDSTTKTFHPRYLTILDSDIWLLAFCKANGFNKYRETLRRSMSDLWHVFQNRNRLGIAEVRKKVRRFTFDVCFVAGFLPGILREPKALLQFALVAIYSRIPFSGKW